MNFKALIKDFLIEDYRSYQAINYSLLKEINNGNFTVIRDGLPERSSSYMDFGSYIDVTIEKGEEPKDLYIYDSSMELSGHSEILVKTLIEKGLINCGIEKRREVADELKLWTTTKDENKRNNLCDSLIINMFLERELVRKEGKKQLISNTDLELAKHILNVLYTHNFSKNIIDPPLRIELLKQLGIKFKFKGEECKVLLDLLQIDHDHKTIQPIDLKTGSKKDFYENYYKYNYYIQGSFYYLALMYIVSMIPELIYYKILPFQFLYISREDSNLPIVYQMTQNTIEKCVEGYINKNGVYKKGIIDLIEDYKFHKSTNIFDMSREVYENNGILTIPEPN